MISICISIKVPQYLWLLTTGKQKFQKDRHISSTKKYIKQNLDELQRELECPNQFIFDFIKDIQQDWNRDSCKLKTRKLQEN